MPDRPLRIVSYNVRYFAHALRGLASTLGPKRRIAAAILTLDPLPDVICLQEVETISVRSRLAHRANHEAESQLEAFMHRLEAAFEAAEVEMPYEAFYFRAHTYRLGETPLYTTGLAVLVNRRTLKVAAHNAEKPEQITHHHLWRWRDRKQCRICAHLKVETPAGRPLHLFNTHLSLPSPFAREFWAQKAKMGYGLNQVAEAKTLVGFVRRHAGGEPFVVCGDFNSPPSSPVYRYLTEDAGFVGAQSSLGRIDPLCARDFPTAGFMRMRMHLDHLFSGGPVNWLDLDGSAPFGEPSGRFFGLSDHIPLIGRFQVGEAKPNQTSATLPA